MNTKDISGIIPPMITPFDRRGDVDEGLHRAEVRYMLRTGVQGVTVCGSTGEGHSLTTHETRQVTAWALEEAQGRLPVITGIICNSTRAAIERGKAVADLGVAALQVTPVHYLFRPDDDAMLRYFDQISQATALPVIIYNVVPWSYLSPRLLVRILKHVDGVIGVKQSASDLKALADLLLLADTEALCRKGVRILSAVDSFLYPSFALGAHGAVAAILTAAPRACVEMWNAVESGDHRRAKQLHQHLLGVWNAIDHPNLPANVKTALRLQGRNGGYPRAPMPASSPSQEAEIRNALNGRLGTG